MTAVTLHNANADDRPGAVLPDLAELSALASAVGIRRELGGGCDTIAAMAGAIVSPHADLATISPTVSHSQAANPDLVWPGLAAALLAPRVDRVTVGDIKTRGIEPVTIVLVVALATGADVPAAVTWANCAAAVAFTRVAPATAITRSGLDG